MLYKGGKVNDSTIYRPVALTNCIAKVFTQILSNRLMNWAEGLHMMPEWQAGFRRKRGCTDQIFTLSSLLQNSINMDGKKLLVLFADFKSSFLYQQTRKLKWKKIFLVFEKHCKMNKLDVNLKKTKIVIFRKGGHCHKKNLANFKNN